MHKQEFLRDFCEFSLLLQGDPRLPFRFEDNDEIIDEAQTNVTYNHRYLLHVGWAARVLAETLPAHHVDIGSCSYFVTIASAFLDLTAYDIRPMEIPLPRMETGVADLKQLPFSDGSLKSVSCMHALEHVGLGRYYDEIDPNGDLKSAKELQRVVAPGGDLLIVVPTGRPRICFNAHRIYSYQHVIDMFSDVTLKEFSYVPSDNSPPKFIKNADPLIATNEDEGAGCFWFTKIGALDA
jgi:SAM-dependent methyltransferase